MSYFVLQMKKEMHLIALLLFYVNWELYRCVNVVHLNHSEGPSIRLMSILRRQQWYVVISM